MLKKFIKNSKKFARNLLVNECIQIRSQTYNAHDYNYVGRKRYRNFAFINLFICLLIHSFIHSFIHLFVRLHVYSFVHSEVRSFVRSFLCSLVSFFLPSFLPSFLSSLLPSLHLSFLPLLLIAMFSPFVCLVVLLSVVSLTSECDDSSNFETATWYFVKL